MIIVVVMLWALIPSLFAPQSPIKIDPSATLESPSPDHLLGTDSLGRDVFSRVIYGARSALTGPLIMAILTIAISCLLALLAGYLGGSVDSLISRVIDVLYSLPPLIIAIVAVGVLGGGYWLALAILTVLNIPNNFRALRAPVLERRRLAYVEAAETLGVSRWRVMVRHLLPNIMPVVAAVFFLRLTYAIVELSSMSFLGLGVPPGTADWGRMLAENRGNVFENPWAAIGPGLAIVFTAVSANIIGDWLYERFEQRARAR